MKREDLHVSGHGSFARNGWNPNWNKVEKTPKTSSTISYKYLLWQKTGWTLFIAFVCIYTLYKDISTTMIFEADVRDTEWNAEQYEHYLTELNPTQHYTMVEQMDKELKKMREKIIENEDRPMLFLGEFQSIQKNGIVWIKRTFHLKDSV